LKRLLDTKKVTRKELIKKLVSMKIDGSRRSSDTPIIDEEKLQSLTHSIRQECDVSADEASQIESDATKLKHQVSATNFGFYKHSHQHVLTTENQRQEKRTPGDRPRS